MGNWFSQAKTERKQRDEGERIRRAAEERRFSLGRQRKQWEEEERVEEELRRKREEQVKRLREEEERRRRIEEERRRRIEEEERRRRIEVEEDRRRKEELRRKDEEEKRRAEIISKQKQEEMERRQREAANERFRNDALLREKILAALTANNEGKTTSQHANVSAQRNMANRTNEEKTTESSRNSDKRPAALDLHGCFVREAVPAAVTFLTARARKYIDHNFDEQYRFCYIITGRGNSSPLNIPSIKPAIEELMKANTSRFKYTWSNDGEIKVDFIVRKLNPFNKSNEKIVVPTFLEASRVSSGTPDNLPATGVRSSSSTDTKFATSAGSRKQPGPDLQQKLPSSSSSGNHGIHSRQSKEVKNGRHIVRPVMIRRQHVNGATCNCAHHDHANDEYEDDDDDDDEYEEDYDDESDEDEDEEGSDEESILAVEECGVNSVTLDLRGEFVRPALAKVEAFLQDMDEAYIASGFDPDHRYCYIITGWGKHSEFHVPKIKPAVINLMAEEWYKLKYQYSWSNEGEMEVDLIGRSYEANFKKRATERLQAGRQQQV